MRILVLEIDQELGYAYFMVVQILVLEREHLGDMKLTLAETVFTLHCPYQGSYKHYKQ